MGKDHITTGHTGEESFVRSVRRNSPSHARKNLVKTRFSKSGEMRPSDGANKNAVLSEKTVTTNRSTARLKVYILNRIPREVGVLLYPLRRSDVSRRNGNSIGGKHFLNLLIVFV